MQDKIFIQRDRCSGHCCERFLLPFSPEKLIEAGAWLKETYSDSGIRLPQETPEQPVKRPLREIYEMDDEEREREGISLLCYNREEITKVSDMAIPLGIGFPGDHHEGNCYPAQQFIYTCKYFERETGNCLNYADRPDVCRSHGVRYECPHPKCTMSGSHVAWDEAGWSDSVTRTEIVQPDKAPDFDD
ncbi:hypothetical protein EHO57_14165 [Leptospira langatensis]|uniref:YkgJ family cysteine cluster protein n=1 Tax=Leptospira langatensis TaxID=2484983 RepID=A0A5R2ATW4_9LEPT|nr:hypothetical protein [Leptospira langatensis]TGJ99899.1 hypothetical protein EHO57_14165 [Leptospira langatensis]